MSLPTPRRRRVQKVRSCDLAFCENAATLSIDQLKNGSHIDDFCPRGWPFTRRGSVHVLEPYQKGETAPTQLSFCSFSPIIRPRSSARLFICPSACSASSRFRVALSARFSSSLLRAHLSARSEPSRSLGSSRPRSAYGSFGSPQNSPLCHVPAPFRTLAISAPSSQLSFPLPRLPRARFLDPPFHIPWAFAFRARSLGASCMPPVASAMQFPVLSSFLGVFSTCHPLFPGNYLADSRGKFGGHCHIPN